MKNIIIFSLFSILICSSAFALQPAVIGGIRDGLALGLMGEEPAGKNVDLRFGAELNTGSQPIVFFFGGKFYLTNAAGRYPMYLGLHAAAYGGSRTTDIGLGLSLILDRVLNVNPLFFEFGVDAAGGGHLQAQAGYKI